jgi:hypothetical protein
MSNKRLAVLLLTPVAVVVFAQSTPQQLEETVNGTVEIQKETQRQQDEWAEEKAALLVRYRAAQAGVQYLTESNAIRRQRAEALEQRIAELRRRLQESVRLSESIQDTLNAIFARLESLVDQDLPFLPQERSFRLETLREELTRPEISAAEKLRRLLEALQVEANYGGTVETYHDRVHVEGDALFVELLRVGRLSLFWRSPDGKRVGEYDRVAGLYTDLPGQYKRNITRAMEMASRRRPVELVALPLGRIRP